MTLSSRSAPLWPMNGMELSTTAAARPTGVKILRAIHRTVLKDGEPGMPGRIRVFGSPFGDIHKATGKDEKGHRAYSRIAVTWHVGIPGQAGRALFCGLPRRRALTTSDCMGRSKETRPGPHSCIVPPAAVTWLATNA